MPAKLKKVCILSTNKYPDGDAGAVRQHSFAKLFTDMGYDVTVIGLGECTGSTVQEYEGVKFISFRSSSSSVPARLGNLLLYKARLREYFRNNTPDTVLVIDIPVNALFYIKKYAKKHSVKLLHDSVEWYSEEEFTHGKADMRYIIKDKYNTDWIDKQFSVIGISTYLTNHFESRGIHCVNIPVIFDVQSTSCEKHADPGKLTLLYAGSPGKKDCLSVALKGLAMLEADSLRGLLFNIVGVTREQLLQASPDIASALEKLGESVCFGGRVPRAQVKEQLEKADFTVLLRPEDMRYAKAGFPTKFGESMVAATPVICNLTSDLGMYLRDGENGLLVNGCTAEAFCTAVKKALALAADKKKAMYAAARGTAEESFDYRLYGDAVTGLINMHTDEE